MSCITQITYNLYNLYIPNQGDMESRSLSQSRSQYPDSSPVLYKTTQTMKITAQCSPRIAEHGYNGITLKTIFKIHDYYSSVLVVTSRVPLYYSVIEC